MISIIKHSRKWYGISGVLLVCAVVGLVMFGLKPSIDFTGGSILEVMYTDTVPDKDFVSATVQNAGIENAEIRGTGEAGYIIKSQTIDDTTKNSIVTALAVDEVPPSVERFNTIGPTLGSELKSKAVVSLLVVIILIVLFIAYTFRSVSKPVSSWKYGFVAIIALVHDIVITLGVFAFTGHYLGMEVDTLFITALLVILGYSINDTIVVLDRVRENLRDKNDDVRKKNFVSIVDTSLQQTFARSINTSLTTLLALAALYLFGAEITRSFSLALLVGILAGTYSSIFLAAPLLVSFFKKKL